MKMKKNLLWCAGYKKPVTGPGQAEQVFVPSMPALMIYLEIDSHGFGNLFRKLVLET